MAARMILEYELSFLYQKGASNASGRIGMESQRQRQRLLLKRILRRRIKGLNNLYDLDSWYWSDTDIDSPADVSQIPQHKAKEFTAAEVSYVINQLKAVGVSIP